MIRTPISLLVAAALSATLLAACSKPEPGATDAPPAGRAAPATASAPAPVAPASNPDAFRFRIGTLDAVALKDGDIDTPNDGKTFGIGQPTADVAALLTAAGQPADTLHLSIQPLLLRSGTQVILFDTGAGDVKWAHAGRLAASLRAAGVEPPQVTDIFISHAHPDHVGGLLTPDGALAFPNATVHLSTHEWAPLKADKGAAKLVAAITPKVATFEPGAEVVPGVVTAVVAEGHTPGHSAYDIRSGEEHLLYIGDTAHHYVVSLRRPQWTLQWDQASDQAKATRAALLKRAAQGNLHVYAVHFPFPGLGRIKAEGDGFAWVPER